MNRTPLVVFLAMSFSRLANGQLPQSHPDFCGMPGALVPVPPNVSAVSYPEKGYSDLFIRSDPAIRLDMDGEIDQACELPLHRIIVFGNSGAYGTKISIVDIEKPALIDTFLVYDPILSPDRRWIVYRKFFPRQTDLLSSDEYLLYDLSKNPAQNRPTEPFSLDRLDTDVGTPIYPPGWKNEPSENIGVPDGQRHGHKSSFFWSPDSRAIVFTDIFQEGEPDVVLIAINEKGATAAFVHPYNAMECKGEDASAMGQQAQPAVAFGPQQETDLLIFVKFQSPGVHSHDTTTSAGQLSAREERIPCYRKTGPQDHKGQMIRFSVRKISLPTEEKK
jgi:hypothetical protein